jgi:phosphatidylglycerol:prolipoprotein diacylglycerol transferase
VAYALLRMVGEIFREPDEGVSLLFGLSRGTFYSVFFVAAGLAVIAWSRKPRTP